MIRQRQKEKRGLVFILQIHTRINSQAKTEPVAWVVSLCERWVLRSQVRPTQSPFSCAAGSTKGWRHWARNGRQNKEEHMNAFMKKTHI